MKDVLGKLPVFAFCMDATYPGLKNVRAKNDFLTYAHRAYVHASQSTATSPTVMTNDDDDDDDKDDDEDSDLDGAVASVHNERAELSKMSTAQLLIADEHELVHIACSINGAGEPQYQLLPALLDRMLRAFGRLRDYSTTEMAGQSELTYILRSDGMNKQKNLGRRAMEALAEIAPEVIWQIKHETEKGLTRAICASRDGVGHHVILLVCF